MTLILEADDDIPAPDSWAQSTTTPHRSESERLARSTQAFLQAGGKIQEIPTGYGTGRVPGEFMAYSDNERFTKEQSKEYETARQKQQSAKSKARAAQLVKKIESLLGTVPTARALYTALGCSDQLMQKLLAEHFADDSRADPYRATSRDSRREALVAEIRRLLAEGQIGMANIAKRVGVNMDRIIALNREYGLNIPKERSGRKVPS